MSSSSIRRFRKICKLMKKDFYRGRQLLFIFLINRSIHSIV